MNRTYFIKSDNLNELVEELKLFDIKIKPYLDNYQHLTYSSEIVYEDTWVINITISDGTKQERTFREIIKPPKLL